MYPKCKLHFSRCFWGGPWKCKLTFWRYFEDPPTKTIPGGRSATNFTFKGGGVPKNVSYILVWSPLKSSLKGWWLYYIMCFFFCFICSFAPAICRSCSERVSPWPEALQIVNDVVLETHILCFGRSIFYPGILKRLFRGIPAAGGHFQWFSGKSAGNHRKSQVFAG